MYILWRDYREKEKVVFHLHEKESFADALANINNLIEDMGKENLDIELLMNGEAVEAAVGEKNENRISYFLKKGVNFSVCSNSLETLDISKDELLDGVETVSAGVSELVKKQNQGWAYVKI